MTEPITDLHELRKRADAFAEGESWTSDAEWIAQVDPQTVLALIDRIERAEAAIGKALTRCASMDRGVGYRVSGDHSTWDSWTEGKSDFAGEVEELLANAGYDRALAEKGTDA